jgi:CBS domain-containing protein
MKVKEIMTRSVETVRPEDSVMDAARKMRDLDVGPMPVAEGEKPVGIVTDRDVAVRVVAEGRDPRTTRVREVMTAGVVTAREDEDVKDVARIMKDRQIRRVLVTDATGRMAGIVSLGDVAVDTSDEKLSGRVLEEVSKPTGAPRS